MRTKNKKDCPEIYLIEAYVSNELSSKSVRERISRHLKSCSLCQALVTEFRQYYSLLEQEKRKPVSSSLFKLIKEVEKENVIIAGILLQPNGVQNAQNTYEYRSEIVLTTQKNGTLDLDDLDCIPIQEDEIFIRAIQSPTTLETTLFLFSHEEKLYRNVKLKTDSDQRTYSSDAIGIIELGCFNIEDLDNQNISIIPEQA